MLVFSIGTILLLVLLIGMTVGQVFLSRMESKWPGLILPAVVFISSLYCLIDYFLIPHHAAELVPNLGAVLIQWLSANIPTLLFLLIYLIVRERRRRKRALNRMNAQDLE